MLSEDARRSKQLMSTNAAWVGWLVLEELRPEKLRSIVASC
jgi:hypothetical protein